MNRTQLLPVIPLFLFIFFSLTCRNNHSTTSQVSRPEPEGERLYFQKCVPCHQPNAAEAGGPGLQCATSRMPAGAWRYLFIKNPDSLLESGDLYARRLRSKYPIQMPAQTVSNAEIDSIFVWIDRAYPCKP